MKTGPKKTLDDYLTQLETARTFYCRDSKNINVIFEAIKQFNQLEKIDLTNSDFDSRTIELLLKKAPNLRQIIIDDERRKDIGNLDLSGSHVTPELLKQLDQKLQIRSVNLSNCQGIPEEYRAEGQQLSQILSKLEENAQISQDQRSDDQMSSGSSDIKDPINEVFGNPDLLKAILVDARDLEKTKLVSKSFHDAAEEIHYQTINETSLVPPYSLEKEIQENTLITAIQFYINGNNIDDLLGQVQNIESQLPFQRIEEVHIQFQDKSLEKDKVRDVINGLLPKGPGVKKIKLEFAKTDRGPLNIDGSDFSRLTELNINRSDINPDSLNNIIAGAQKTLRVLDISDYMTCSLIAIPDELPNLVSLGASNSNIDGQTLGNILRAAKNTIRKVNLYRCNQLESEQDFGALQNLKHLASLDISFSNISPEILTKILKASKIEYFELIENETIGGLATEDIGDELNDLRYIRAAKSKITVEVVSKILTQAQNLETVVLNRCNHLDQLDVNIELPKLIVFRADGTKIKLEKIQEILNNSPNIKELTLNECSNLEGDLDLSQDSGLSKLESLNVGNSNISPESLLRILEKAENIKSVNLEWCSDERIPAELRNGNIIKIEEIKNTLREACQAQTPSENPQVTSSSKTQLSPRDRE